MLNRHAILRAVVPALAATVLAASGASAMPMWDASAPGPSAHRNVLSPDLADAAAHAATIRAIGAARIARASG